MTGKTLSKSSPKVYIVIIVYNGMKWVDNCIKSVSETNYSNFKIIIVDNCSNDQSAEYIKENFKDVIIIKNKKNLGTAVGNNIGIRYALKNGADYVVMFNQDIKVEKDWLIALIEVAESHPKIGILSPLQYDYRGKDLDTVFQRILSETKYFEDLEKNEVKTWYLANRVIGASMCVRREVFKTIGLFDPIFFMFEEDMDLCRRAVFRGFEAAHVTKSKVFHYHVHHNTEPPTWIKYIQRRNQLVFLLKDPEQSFLYNLKKVFLWTDWDEIFQKVEHRRVVMLRAFLFIICRLPIICYHYHKERKVARYL